MAIVSAAPVVLDARHLSYSYPGSITALDEVSLTVSAGESLALLGANGCGKSTLLKILDGLTFPSAGSYRAFGAEVSEAALAVPEANAAFRAAVGFVFQSSQAQLFSPTVREELEFGCRQIGLDAEATEAHVRDTLALLDLEDLAERPPFHLSGGQAKRVALGSVLVMGPEVLLLDEPTAALDPRTQLALTDVLLALHDAGRTLVLASHDLDVVRDTTTRAIVIGEDHRVVADGATSEILADSDLLQRVNLIAPPHRRL